MDLNYKMFDNMDVTKVIHGLPEQTRKFLVGYESEIKGLKMLLERMEKIKSSDFSGNTDNADFMLAYGAIQEQASLIEVHNESRRCIASEFSFNTIFPTSIDETAKQIAKKACALYENSLT